MNIHINTTLIDHVAQALFKHRLVNWVKSWVTGLFSNITATADATHSATPTVTPTYQNGVLTLAFSGLQGAAGQDGADGSKWYSVNSTSVFNTAQDQSGIPTSGTAWKEGDYMLNAYYGYIFKCTYLFAGGTLSSWSYEGCIKGADGQDGQDGLGVTAIINYSNSAAGVGQIGDTGWNQMCYRPSSIPYAISASGNTSITRLRSDGQVNVGDMIVLYGEATDNHQRYMCFAVATAASTSGSITLKELGGMQLLQGANGTSPAASVSKSGGTATITITDANGTTTAQVSDGTNGNDGATWANGTAVSSATSAVPSGMKVGDYYLNTSTYNVWKCISTSDTNKWSSICNIKGTPGEPGADGSIVSKAYRFNGRITNSVISFGSGNDLECYVRLADARITLNEKTLTANIHLTYYLLSLPIDWSDLMHSFNAYEGGSSVVGVFTGDIYDSNNSVVLSLPASNSANAFYGTLNIRHDRGWPADTQENERFMVLDLHGVVAYKDPSDFEKIFADDSYFSFAIN